MKVQQRRGDRTGAGRPKGPEKGRASVSIQQWETRRARVRKDASGDSSECGSCERRLSVRLDDRRPLWMRIPTVVQVLNRISLYRILYSGVLEGPETATPIVPRGEPGFTVGGFGVGGPGQIEVCYHMPIQAWRRDQVGAGDTARTVRQTWRHCSEHAVAMQAEGNGSTTSAGLKRTGIQHFV